MMENGLLLSLPHGIITELLTEWIDFRDVVMLDSAFCQKSNRREWLQCLDSDSIVFNVDFSKIGNPQQASLLMMMWIISKRVRVSSYSLISPMAFFGDTLSNITTFLNWSGKHMKELDIAWYHGELLLSILVEVAQSCTKLQELLFCGCELNEKCLNGVLCCCTTSTGLTFDECNCDAVGGDNNIESMDINCPAIKKFKMHNYATDSIVVAFAKVFPNLREMKLTDGALITDAALVAVADHCPQLEKLSVHRVSAITDAGIAAVARNCNGLIGVKFLYCPNITDFSILALTQHCRAENLSS